MIVPLILSGGAGTRLWPLSSGESPKQFHRIHGPHTLLQATASRLAGMSGVAPPWVVGSARHAAITTAQLAEVGIVPEVMIEEPTGRNTGPAIAAAAHVASMRGVDPVFAILPSDHVVADVGAFQDAMRTASDLAEAANVVAFGIVPTRAETGYGYIAAGSKTGSGGFHVDGFVEKPDAETAERFLASGSHYWNSGMFVVRASVCGEELRSHSPDVWELVVNAIKSADDPVILAQSFAGVPEISFDHAVMEKTRESVVVPLDAGWSDIGSWLALWDVSERDDAGNTISGRVEVVNVSDTLVRTDGPQVAVLGVSGVAVVATREAVLVVSMDHTQDVRSIGQIFDSLTDDGSPQS